MTDGADDPGLRGAVRRAVGGALDATVGRVGGAVGGRSGADELHQRPFGRAAGRGAHVGAAHEGQSSGTDREETLRFGRGKDDGKPASGSQQAEDGVEGAVPESDGLFAASCEPDPRPSQGPSSRMVIE